ncbi:MAG: carbohydrate-binding protein, partial [Lentisphaerota bacterium]
FSLEDGSSVEEHQNHFIRKLELPPHSLAVWIVTAKGSSAAETENASSVLKQKIEVIKTFKAWPSPDYTSVQTLEVGKWNEAIKAPLYFSMYPKDSYLAGISDKSLIYLGQAAMDSASTLELQVAINKDLAGGTVELRLDSPEGAPIAMVSLAQPTEGWTDFAVRAAPVKTGLSGIHKLFLVFQTAKGSGACNFKAWRFVSN